MQKWPLVEVGVPFHLLSQSTGGTHLSSIGPTVMLDRPRRILHRTNEHGQTTQAERGWQVRPQVFGCVWLRLLGSTHMYNCHDELYEFGGQCVVALNAEAVTLRPSLRWSTQFSFQFTGRQPIACAGSCYLTGGGTSRKALDGKQKESPAN